MTKLAFLASLLAAVAAVDAADVCKCGVYSSLAPLSKDSGVRSYCHKSYPIPTHTVKKTLKLKATVTVYTTAATTSVVSSFSTSTIPTVTTTTNTETDSQSSTEVDTTTSTVVDSANATITTTVFSSPPVPGPTTTEDGTLTIVDKRAFQPYKCIPGYGVDCALSSLKAQKTSVIRTFCSCIGTTPTATATVTNIKTSTVTKTVSTILLTTTTSGVLTTSTSTETDSATITTTFATTTTNTILNSTTTTATATSAVYVIPCGNPASDGNPACDVSHPCATSGPSGQGCSCYQLVNGGSACAFDQPETTPTGCSSDSDCGAGLVCFSTCLGQTCQPYQNECNNPQAPSRLFRRVAAAKKSESEVKKRDSEGRLICGNSLCAIDKE